MFFNGATAAGDPAVPNEDWVAVTPDLMVLLDGATTRTESGCSHDPAWYTSKLGDEILAGAASKNTPLQQVLADAISEVAALHPECDLDHPGAPSAAAALVRLDGDVLRYTVLGDVTVVLDTTEGVRTISDQRVSRTASDERAEADRHPIGSPEKDAALVKMKHAELAAQNRPGGYWVAAADPTVVEHATSGEVDAATVKRLAVVSDGVARLVDLFRLSTWSTVLNTIARHGPNHLLEDVRRAELADPRGIAHPRNKRSDDATVAYAEPTRAPSDAALLERGVVSQQRSQELAQQITGWLNRSGAARGIVGPDGAVTKPAGASAG